MKTMLKSIFKSAALWVAAAVSFTACEVDTTTVMFEDDHTFAEPGDTVFSMLGILAQVQEVAERNVLLGELRGDLVVPNPDYASMMRRTEYAAWLDLANFENLEDTTFNRYRDYYAIVNNCNFYLDRADAAMERGGEQVFLKEYAAVSAYRAWAYLQLALIYGEVPFYTEPLLAYSDIERVMNDASNRKGLEEICTYFIDDLQPYVDVPHPGYGIYFSGSSCFLPVRLLLGDLYLWRGSKTGSAADYAMAAQEYRDYLFENQEATTPNRNVVYTTDAFDNVENTWSGVLTREALSDVPYAAEAIDGKISTQLGAFSYFEGSAALENLVDNSYYCFVAYTEDDGTLGGDTDEPDDEPSGLSRFEGLVDASAYYPSTGGNPVYYSYIGVEGTPQYMPGDLRFYSATASEATGLMPDKYYTGSDVVTYRTGAVYLRLAEAINRAGYPLTGFAVLKYGLSRGNLIKYDANGEYARLMASGYTFYDFNDNKANIGIHARGCGNAEMDTLHYSLPALPTREDSILKVEEMICDEMALETAYEGYRFFDLMRMSFSRRDPSFLARKVARRNSPDNPDNALLQKLSDEANWYLPMVEN